MIRSTYIKRCFFFLIVVFVYVMLSYHLNPLKTAPPELEIAKTKKVMDIVEMNTTAVILPDEVTTILQPFPSRLCLEKGVRQYLLFMFISSPENLKSRNIIRGILNEHMPKWDADITSRYQGYHKNESVRAFFFVGMPTNGATNLSALEKEGTTYGDLIIEDFQEAYLNLTVKTIRMLKWVENNCPNVLYTIKIDDDVFINVPVILKLLKKYDVSSGLDLIAGHKYTAIDADSNFNSKWYTPKIAWHKKLPNFAAGFCYILGSRVRSRLYENALQTPLFHLEDVFLTGIVREKYLDVDVVNFPVYAQWPFPKTLMPACKVAQEIAVIHPLSAEKTKCYMQFTENGISCVMPYVLPMIVFC